VERPVTDRPSKLTGEAAREFLAEADEIVEQLFGGFSRIDEQRRSGRVNPALLNEVFRAAHSLKGLAGMFGLEAVTRLAHEMESVLDAVRLGRRQIDNDLMRLLYRVSDTFRGLLQTVRAGNEPALSDVEAVLQTLAEDADGPGEDLTGTLTETLSLSAEALSVLTEYEEHRLSENLRARTPIYKVYAALMLERFETDLSALTSTIEARGEVITTLPSADSSGAGINFDVVFASDDDLASVTARLVELDEGYRVERLDRAPAAAARPASTATASAAPAEERMSVRQVSETVRVDIQKLDELMGIVGELVLARGGLSRVSDELKVEMGFRGVAVDLHRLVRTMERRIVDLQSAIMQVRMVPLGQVFDRMGRIIRRTASELDKDILFEVSGEETELDKLLVEDLVDPLMHLVRNAVDHGIESAGVRRAAGKPAHGTLRVRAFPRGNHVVIEVEDDGRGIDEVAVKRAALERGVVDEDHIGALTRRDVWNLIFNAGLSTRKEVSDTSGRGVGLDVVKHNISQMSGIIEVESEQGRGTLFTITLPITLAIIQALIIRCGRRVYALPLASVLEILAVDPEDLCRVEGREMLQVRGQTLPTLRMAEYFGVESAADGAGYAAVVGLAQHRVALFVDDVIGQQDIVIKSLGTYLSNVRGIAGATHMGDHETILVLDVAALIQELLDRSVEDRSRGIASV
jgi:two-component system chemotaxis sensor kinase CheA